MYVPICLLLDSALHLLSFYLLPWISWICKAQNGLLSQIQVLYYAGWLRLAILITGFPNTNGAVSNLTYVKKSFIINSRGHPTWKAGQLGKWDWKSTVILLVSFFNNFCRVRRWTHLPLGIRFSSFTILQRQMSSFSSSFSSISFSLPLLPPAQY